MAIFDRNLHIPKPIYRILFRYAVEHIVKEVMVKTCFIDETRTELSAIFRDSHRLLDGDDCFTNPYEIAKVEKVIVACLKRLTDEEKVASIIYVVECKHLGELYFESLDIEDRELEGGKTFEERFRDFLLSDEYNEEVLNKELVVVLLDDVANFIGLFDVYSLDEEDIVDQINKRLESRLYYLTRTGPM